MNTIIYLTGAQNHYYIFQSMLEEAGYNPRSYSGRGMYGKSCLGVEINGNVGKLFAKIVEELSYVDRNEVGSGYIFEEVSEAFENMETDSMGLDTIVYFPGTPFVDSEAEEDTEAE